jgi:hypothetical protein
MACDEWGLGQPWTLNNTVQEQEEFQENGLLAYQLSNM